MKLQFKPKKWTDLVPELLGNEKHIVEAVITHLGDPKRATFKVEVYEPAYFLVAFSWDNVYLSITKTVERLRDGNHQVSQLLELYSQNPRYSFVLGNTGKIKVYKDQIPHELFPIPPEVIENMLRPWKKIISAKFGKQPRTRYLPLSFESVTLTVRVEKDTKIKLAYWRKNEWISNYY